MNVMSTAWILYRGNCFNYTFRYCLSTAWKLSKAKVKTVWNHYTLKLRSKELSNLVQGLETKDNIIYVKDERDYKLLFHFLRYL